MIENTPMEVQTRGRIYTSRSQRSRLGIDFDSKGYGTDVEVGIMIVDRSPNWGTYGKTATFPATLGTYGGLRIPKGVRDTLDLSEGETVRTTIARC